MSDTARTAELPVYSRYMHGDDTQPRVTIYDGSVEIEVSGRVIRKPAEAWHALAGGSVRVVDFQTALTEAGLTEVLMLNAAVCCDGRIEVDVNKRQAIIDKLHAVARVLKSGSASNVACPRCHGTRYIAAEFGQQPATCPECVSPRDVLNAIEPTRATDQQINDAITRAMNDAPVVVCPMDRAPTPRTDAKLARMHGSVRILAPELVEHAREMERELDAARKLANIWKAAFAESDEQAKMDVPAVTDEMVNRFLSWKLPETFGPDCHIRFERAHARANDSWPVGTNLFTATEARAMLEHVMGINHKAADWAPLCPHCERGNCKAHADRQPKVGDPS